MPRPKRAVPIDRYVARTLADVAAELGVTAQAVGHVEKRAMKKIKLEFVRRGVVTKEGRYDAR